MDGGRIYTAPHPNLQHTGTTAPGKTAQVHRPYTGNRFYHGPTPGSAVAIPQGGKKPQAQRRTTGTAAGIIPHPSLNTPLPPLRNPLISLTVDGLICHAQENPPGAGVMQHADGSLVTLSEPRGHSSSTAPNQLSPISMDSIECKTFGATVSASIYNTLKLREYAGNQQP